VVIAVAIVLYVVIAASSGGYSHLDGKPVSPSVYTDLGSGISFSTLANVGSGPGNITPPKSITGNTLTLNGKPEILYVGGEYCPYCALERWSLIIALSKFGNFSGLQYMQSSATDVNALTPTFTFASATYSSPYIAFDPVEEWNQTNEQTVWHTLDATQSSLVSQYGTGGIPFVDFANQWVINGVQSAYSIAGQNWTGSKGVIPQLNNPNSQTARYIDGAANTIITAICKIDGGQPASVCTQSFAALPISYAVQGSPSSPLIVQPGLVVSTESVIARVEGPIG
jgi:hypothetical protein